MLYTSNIKMLLYIENKLSTHEMEEYSKFLRKNPKEMKKVIEISKALALCDINQHQTIHMIEIVQGLNNHLNFMVEGLVELLDQKHLMFRSTHQVALDCFSFFDLTLQFIKKNNTEIELIVTSEKNISFELLNLDDVKTEMVFSDSIVKLYFNHDYLLKYLYNNNSELLFISFS
ncbi:MAG: hypothetical protein ACRCV0_07285 [Brevinema sp.]